MKRSNNVSIALSRFKIPFPVIRKALLSLDESILAASHVNTLRRTSVFSPSFPNMGYDNGTIVT
jgi:hypothetical protein